MENKKEGLAATGDAENFTFVTPADIQLVEKGIYRAPYYRHTEKGREYAGHCDFHFTSSQNPNRSFEQETVARLLLAEHMDNTPEESINHGLLLRLKEIIEIYALANPLQK